MAALAGCTLTPAARIDQLAQAHDFTREVAQGAGFRHVIYSNQETGQDGALHVYLSGDGSPWLSRKRISDDPTPRRPIALRLMTLDTASSLYVGRPCYHGLAQHPPCHPGLWTTARYGEPILASMAAVVNHRLARTSKTRVILIGFSGGGTLAMLLGERIPATSAIVTIAANLDVRAWSALHGFSPLSHSLDPATRPPLPAHIRQIHLAGSADRSVPPAIVTAAISRQPAATLRVFDGFDHSCCWQSIWPQALSGL
jgi:hypothetical protein